MFTVVIMTLTLLAILSIAGPGGVAWSPWVPSKGKDMDRILSHLQLKNGQHFVDFGAGDGKILTALFKKNQAEAAGGTVRLSGVEISPITYLIGRARLLMAGISGKVNYRLSSFLKYPLNTTDVVYCFLTPSAMARLKPWLEERMKPGSRHVSYVFPVPGWVPETIDRPSENDLPIYIYNR